MTTELEGLPEAIEARTWQGHPRVLPSLVWAKSYVPDVALPGKAFPLGPQSEVSDLPCHDLTPGKAGTGPITPWLKGLRASFPWGMLLNNALSGQQLITRRISKASQHSS